MTSHHHPERHPGTRLTRLDPELPADIAHPLAHIVQVVAVGVLELFGVSSSLSLSLWANIEGMSTLQLKESLHKMVVETDDPLILEQVAALFAALRQDEDWWDLISETEKRKIEIGMAQAAARQIVPHEMVREEAKRILKGEKRSGRKL